MLLPKHEANALPLLAGDAGKTWIAVGNTFLKIPSSKARNMLESDQKLLDVSVNKLRSKLKESTSSALSKGRF